MRVGLGFDVHRFAAPEDGKPLVLMGLTIPHDRGLAGHSDALRSRALIAPDSWHGSWRTWALVAGLW
jgi:hypothetical protein